MPVSCWIQYGTRPSDGERMNCHAMAATVRGDDERQEHAGTEESDELEVLAVEQQCERECDDHDDRSVGHCVDEGVLDVGPEVGALEQLDVVVEADELAGAVDAVGSQRRDERLDCRIENEDCENDESRCGEQQAGAQVAGLNRLLVLLGHCGMRGSWGGSCLCHYLLLNATRDVFLRQQRPRRWREGQHRGLLLGW